MTDEKRERLSGDELGAEPPLPAGAWWSPAGDRTHVPEQALWPPGFEPPFDSSGIAGELVRGDEAPGIVDATRAAGPPRVTQPTVTQPTVTQPPVTQPPVTQPAGTQPPVASQPPVALGGRADGRRPDARRLADAERGEGARFAGVALAPAVDAGGWARGGVARFLTRWVGSTPPWAVSTVVHALLLVLLSLWYLPTATRTVLSIVVGPTDEVGEPWVADAAPLPTYELSVPAAESLAGVESTSEPVVRDVPLEIELESLGPDLVARTGRSGLSGRRGATKQALLLAYGGTEETEQAVRRGLEWLVRQQQRDGAWSLKGPYPDGGSIENQPAATAMALLALLGAGHTDREGEHQAAVKRGAQALLDMQDREGVVTRSVRVETQRLYTQAQATIVFCELYGLTQDARYREAAQRALDYAADIQARDGRGGAGWRYQPREDIDTSVTGWFVMALQSGKMGGLDVSDEALEGVSKYLDSVTDDGGATYAYKPGHRASPVMTAEALLCRQYLGWQQGDPRMEAGVRTILASPLDWDKKDVYYWYYATQTLHHLGGEAWEEWNTNMRQVLPARQDNDGRTRGSWAPRGDEHAGAGGRLYTTCLCLYCLEVYYRHLPIYR